LFNRERQRTNYFYVLLINIRDTEQIRTLLNLRKGENIIFEVEDSKVTIKPEKKEDIKIFLDEFFNSVPKENIAFEDI